MTNTIAIIIDVILALIVLYFLVKGAKKGFVTTLILMISWIVSFGGAYFLSGVTKTFIYDGFIGPGVEKSISAAIQEKNPNELVDSITKEIDKMPKIVQNIAGFTFGDVSNSIESYVDEETAKIPKMVSENIVKPVVMSLLGVILFFIFFTILSFVMRSVSRIFRGKIRIPIIGQINTILGGLLGAVQGIIIICILIIASNFIIAITNNSLEYLNSDITEKTVVYKTIADFSSIVKIDNTL